MRKQAQKLSRVKWCVDTLTNNIYWEDEDYLQKREKLKASLRKDRPIKKSNIKS